LTLVNPAPNFMPMNMKKNNTSSFDKRWINFLYTTSTGTAKIRNLLTPLGVIIFGSFVFIFVVASIYTDYILNLPKFGLNVWNIIISALFLIFGLFCIGWSVIHFLRVKGTPVPLNPPPKLVCKGPYAYTRNPMLTGIYLFLFGIGFGISNLSLILIFTPLFIIINTIELKMIEEPELEKRLGKDYLAYKKRTPMYFPRLRSVLR
jgi:protein-S-isoprenylcysteine O-methyltransferase Ste14